MRRSWLLRSLLAASCIALYPASPATAGRTVVDGGSIMTLSGYCSPETATNNAMLALRAADRSPDWRHDLQSVLGEQQRLRLFREHRIVHGPVRRRTSTPAQREPLTIWLDSCVQSQFRGRGGLFRFHAHNTIDGNFIADTTLTANGFSVNWYTCGSPLFCGTRTVNLISGATFSQTDFDNFTGLSFALAQQSQLPGGTGTDLENFLSGQQFLIALGNSAPVYNMTLTTLASGFQVDYNYNAAADATFGFYGYNLPTGTFETFFELNNRTFVFNSTSTACRSLRPG